MKYWMIPILVIALLLTGCASSSDTEGDSTAVLSITAENFESLVLQSEKTVLLDFYADWCGPCKKMAPSVEAIATERTDIVVGKINVDSEKALATQYGIEAMPTLIVIKNGKVVKKAVGYRSKAAIEQLLN